MTSAIQAPMRIKAPMRKQGDNAASTPNIPGPAIEAARIIPRLAPGGLYWGSSRMG